MSLLLDRPFQSLIERTLDAEPDSAARNRIGAELALDCLRLERRHFDVNLASAILDRFADGVVASTPALQRLKDLKTYLASLPSNAKKEGSDSALGGGQADWSDLADYAAGPFTSVDALQAVLEAPGTPTPAYYWSGRIQRMRELTAIGDRIAFLNSLCDIPLSGYDEHQRAEAVLDTVQLWRSAPSIADWASRKLPEQMIRSFRGFLRRYRGDDGLLLKALDLTGLSPTSRLTTLVEGVQGALIAHDEALFGVTETMLGYMPIDEIAKVLQWYSTRLGNRIARDPEKDLDASTVPSTVDAAFGRFLFVQLGDVDTRQRWRAAHALRRIARLEADRNVFDAVVLGIGLTSDKTFVEPDAPFYWIGARMWLSMTLDRIASEKPSALSGHIDTLLGLAQNADLPHVVIRENAKRAIIKLSTADGSIVLEGTLDTIRKVNVSPLKRVKDKGHRNSSGWGKYEDLPFHFDSMDTLPYLYSRLLDLFPRVSGSDLLRRAVDYIVTAWKVPPDAFKWVLEPRKKRFPERQFGLWSHSHGGLPAIERFHYYAELHAMLCVASDLLQNSPLKDTNDSYERFDEWITRYLPTYSEYWLSDLRGAVPLQDGFWSPDPRDAAIWLRAASRQDFLREVRLGPGADPQWMVISADYELRHGNRRTDVSISSALVTPETAPALARALRGTDARYEMYLPRADDRDDDDGLLSSLPYQLDAWLVYPSNDTQFDEHDPLRCQTAGVRASPCSWLTDLLELERIAGNPLCWRSKRDGEVSVRGEVWSDLTDMEGYHEHNKGSAGWRLLIRRDHLAKVLEARNLDLILKVDLTRRLGDRRSYDSDKEKSKHFGRGIICGRGGRIGDGTGSIGSWSKARQRTRGG